MYRYALLLLCLAGSWAQQPGTNTEEQHLPLPIQTCDESGCVTEDTSIVIDGDPRYLYDASDPSRPCQGSSGWDSELCPDGLTCAQNCAIDGFTAEDYETRFGLTTSGNTVRLNYVTQSEYGTSVGSRSYLITSEEKYRMFNLKNREFTVDIDTSNLECGMNGGVYFSEMPEDGGTSTYPTNQAGAKYGTGYCDGQCFNWIRYSAGQVNIQGVTDYGVCCIEMDIWESNKWSATYTTHGCSVDGYYLCYGVECGNGDDYHDGVCDKAGCEFGSNRVNDRYFFGANDSYVVDSRRPFTIVTQFITSDGTDTGDLVEIRRFYVQDGVVIDNAVSNWEGMDPFDSLSDDYCSQSRDLFGDVNDFADVGGLKVMGDAFERGMVLVFTFWDDSDTHMRWLDSLEPPTGDPSTPGVYRGPCPTDSGDPTELHQDFPNAYVTFSNVKVGTIGSTVQALSKY